MISYFLYGLPYLYPTLLELCVFELDIITPSHVDSKISPSPSPPSTALATTTVVLRRGNNNDSGFKTRQQQRQWF
ncbi:hypothetical protein RRG08_034528 [Elysia crispata]|uniref:Uncharacterized protein n=1 Tax=Elysia crispata TaxID=231223 RepID=A0AAE1BA89_9GAST|nr:hypothetical protein RRG08_034528 [Elysia crispata]